MWKLERVLEENPISSVLDLEEEQISINRFVGTDLNDFRSVYYLELDSRIEISSSEVNFIFMTDDCENGLKELQHFARKINVDSGGDIIIETTQGRGDLTIISEIAFTDCLAFSEQLAKFTFVSRTMK